MKIPLHSIADYTLHIFIIYIYNIITLTIYMCVYMYLCVCIHVCVYMYNPNYIYVYYIVYRNSRYIMISYIRVCLLLIVTQFCTFGPFNRYSTRLLCKVSIISESTFPLLSLVLHREAIPQKRHAFYLEHKGALLCLLEQPFSFFFCELNCEE